MQWHELPSQCGAAGPICATFAAVQQAAAECQNPAQTPSSSKNAGPFCELEKLKLFDLTG